MFWEKDTETLEGDRLSKLQLVMLNRTLTQALRSPYRDRSGKISGSGEGPRVPRDPDADGSGDIFPLGQEPISNRDSWV